MNDEQFKPSIWTAPEPCVGRVLVLPGEGYTVDHPLLFWACHVADSAGWQVSTLHWQIDPNAEDGPVAFVEHGADILDATAPAAGQTVVIAKSLGTLAVRWANQHAYPGVWLTPLLNDDHVTTGLAASSMALIVGGTSDRHWNSDIAGALGCDIVEVERASHALTVGGDWRRSLAGLTTTLNAIEAFLDTAGQATDAGGTKRPR